jgi:transcriptional regulator with XRE-family HTH domain
MVLVSSVRENGVDDLGHEPVDTEHIGARVRRWRLRRGMTQRVLADFANFSQGYIAQIELGLTPLARRTSVEALAHALQISVGELTGHPDDRRSYHPISSTAMAGLKAGVVAFTHPEVIDVSCDPELQRPMLNAAALDSYLEACRYDILVPALGDALTALGFRLSCALSDTERGANLREAVQICATTASACLQLEATDLALVFAQAAMRSAEELADPVWLGLANYVRVKAVYGTAGVSRLAARGIELLSPHVGASTSVATAYGMHHLLSAEIAAREGHAGMAFDHLTEAGRVAARTGEVCGDWYSFGPTNVGMWRVAILVALGEGPAARLMPVDFQPETISSHNRRASYYIELSRALLQGKGMERAAVTAMYRADAVAPQQVAVSAAARSAVESLLSRPRFGSDRRLRGFANRIGIRD